MKIDNEALFRQTLETGVNLFLGAGFSTLECKGIQNLPVAKDLCKEIDKGFELNGKFGNDLETISTYVSTIGRQRYEDFLRKKYKVTDYNKKYNLLNRINIKSIITTNIDNIVYMVMDNSNRYYLRNIMLYGIGKNQGAEIPYVPLHGDVLNNESHLYFGKFDLATVAVDNKDLFSQLNTYIFSSPTLFWGYNFRDTGVLGILRKVLPNKKHNIWIQCMPGDPNIDLYQSLNCDVIIGDTEKLFHWIDNNLIYDKKDDNENRDYSGLEKYKLPTMSTIESVPIEDYYKNAQPHWYHVITDKVCETSFIRKICDSIISFQNVMVTGMSFTGKTTAFMQVALKANFNGLKLIARDLTPEEAKYIINILKGRKALILLDDCTDDIQAYNILARQSNINVVGFSTDYSFESSKHLIDGVVYQRVDITELSDTECQRIYEKIPKALKKDKFVFRKNESENFSMFELVANNVNDVITRSKILTMLKGLKRTNEIGYRCLVIGCYLHQYESILSTDVVVSYLRKYNLNYDKIYGIITKLDNMLKQYDTSIGLDLSEQDYYIIRSNVFSEFVVDVMVRQLREDFKEMLEDLILNVSPIKIYKYYVFRRKAFDADLIFDVFHKDGNNIYEYIYGHDESAYTLQQWALYLAKTKDFSTAFSYIDKAIDLQKNNFSIRNSRAIILFEANKDKDSELSLKYLKESMGILELCYESDKRKIFHAQKYSEFALYLCDYKKINHYLSIALKWINEIIKKDESRSKKTYYYRSELQKRLS